MVAAALNWLSRAKKIRCSRRQEAETQTPTQWKEERKEVNDKLKNCPEESLGRVLEKVHNNESVGGLRGVTGDCGYKIGLYVWGNAEREWCIKPDLFRRSKNGVDEAGLEKGILFRRLMWAVWYTKALVIRRSRVFNYYGNYSQHCSGDSFKLKLIPSPPPPLQNDIHDRRKCSLIISLEGPPRKNSKMQKKDVRHPIRFGLWCHTVYCVRRLPNEPVRLAL